MALSRRKQEQAIERHLKRYRTYKVGLKTLEKQLDYIMPNTTARYELQEGSTGTFNIYSSTEKYAIDRIESKKAFVIYENMEHYRMIVESIDEAIKDLTENERKYVERVYFNGEKVSTVAPEVGFTEGSVYSLRTKIFDKLVISLQGLTQF